MCNSLQSWETKCSHFRHLIKCSRTEFSSGFDTQHPGCLHIWKSGADLILAHSRSIYETKCNFFPPGFQQIIQGPEIDHWGLAFLIAQDNKLTKEWDHLVRILLISPQVKQPWCSPWERGLFVVAVFSFPRSPEVIRRQSRQWRLDRTD